LEKAMMFDIILDVVALIILGAMAWIVWESSVMISEKKDRQRKGITDYYDNPIVKEKDETVS
jgi:hypothetical protein